MKKNLLLTLAVIAAIATGCNKSTTIETSEGKVKVSENAGGQIEVQTKDGKATVAASDSKVSIPETFPKDVPIVDGAVAKLSMTQGKTELLHLSVPRPVETVAKEYSEKLKAGGWSIESTMNMGDTAAIQAKKENRTCSAVVMKEDGGSLVQLSVTTNETTP